MRSLESYGSLAVSLLLAVSAFDIIVVYPASFLWTPPYPRGFWGEYVLKNVGLVTSHSGYANGDGNSGTLWLATSCSVTGTGTIASQACGGMGSPAFTISSSATSSSLVSFMNKERQKRRAEAIALLRLLEQKVEEAVSKPGLFNELSNQETSENESINSIPVTSFTFTATASKWASVVASVEFKGMFEAIVYGGAVGKYETKAYLYVFDNTIGRGASYLMNGIPNDYSKEITAAGALLLPVDDTLMLTADFEAIQGHQYQITIELYLTATAVASAGHAHVSICFYSRGQPSWNIKINSIDLSY